jgi:hypothetical protein
MDVGDMATNSIINPAVPNLPIGPEGYERRFQDQFANILRLYFNQLNGTLNSLTTSFILSTTVYKVADLPSATTAGQRTFVSDSNTTTFNATVVGSGSNTVPVFSNGTNWKVG